MLSNRNKQMSDDNQYTKYIFISNLNGYNDNHAHLQYWQALKCAVFPAFDFVDTKILTLKVVVGDGVGERHNVRALKYTLMIFWTSIQVKVEIQKKQEVKIHFVASSTIV